MYLRCIVRTAALFGISAALLVGSRTAHAQLTFSYSTFAASAGYELPEADGISASGTIVGAHGDAGTGTVYGYVRTAGPGGTYLQNRVTSPDVNAVATVMKGVNSAGYATGQGTDSNFAGISSFIYNINTNTYTVPTVAGAAQTFFNNVSEQNKVAVVYYNNTNDTLLQARGAIYDINTGTFTNVGGIAGYASFLPQTILSNGNILGNAIDSSLNRTGVLVTSTGNRFISVPGAISTFANAVTSTGLISGTYYASDNLAHGYVYDTNTNQYYTLDYPGAGTGETIMGFGNNDNTLVATYVTGGGASYENVAVNINYATVPEPSALALFAPAGIVGFTLIARRRKLKSTRMLKINL